jgi:hypothetical protein
MADDGDIQINAWIAGEQKITGGSKPHTRRSEFEIKRGKY